MNREREKNITCLESIIQQKPEKNLVKLGKNEDKHQCLKKQERSLVWHIKVRRLGTRTKQEFFQKKLEERKGSKHPMFGKKHKASSIEKMRKATLHQPPTTKDTKPEKILQKLLKSKGIKFEKHTSIFGRPDLFIEPKTCIFVDGDYYHANKNDYKRNGKTELGFRNRPNKILRGKFRAKDKWQRDSKVNQTLRKEGYVVLRLWQSELDYKPEKCLQKILRAIK